MGYLKKLPGISEESTTRRKFLVGSGYGIVGLGVLGAAAGPQEDNNGGIDGGGDGGSDGGGDGGSSSQEQPPGTRWHDPDSEIGVLEGVEAEVDSIGSMYIRGTAENFSDTDYEYVQLEFEVYDETDAKIADGLANTSGLSAGQQWRFEALAASAEDVDSYSLSDITAY